MEFRDRIEMKLCIIKGFDVNFGSVCSSHLSYISHPLYVNKTSCSESAPFIAGFLFNLIVLIDKESILGKLGRASIL